MIPMGDAKGAALVLMVELLAAGMTGSNYAADASSFLDTKGGPPGVGQLIIGFDPKAFGGNAVAIERAGWSLLKAKAALFGLAGVFGVLSGMTLVGTNEEAFASKPLCI